jgi:hypothetical protein
MSEPTLPLSLLQAIAKQEGFYQPGRLAFRNHNPGNIISGLFATSHGATGSDAPFALRLVRSRGIGFLR